MSVEPAFKFIDHFGNVLESYRVKYLFQSVRDDEVPLSYLRRLQNEDGGFPYDLEAGKPSSVNETSGMLALIAELDLGASDVGQKVAGYLFRVQRPDGGWDENPEVNQFSPPAWDTPNALYTRMWLTGDVTMHLVQLGYAESQGVKLAREFLLNHLDEKGKAEGPRIATWIAMAIFGRLEGRESQYVRRALDLVEGWLDEEPDEDAPFLCWYLECLSSAEVPRDHALVRKCLKKLIRAQDEDGGWKSADGVRYNVPTTINALKLLKQYGEW